MKGEEGEGRAREGEREHAPALWRFVALAGPSLERGVPAQGPANPEPKTSTPHPPPASNYPPTDIF